MFQKSQDRFQWTGTNICTRFGTFYNMQCTTNRSCQYLCLITLNRIYLGYLGDQLYPIPAAVINATNKRGHIGSTGLCSQDCLTSRKYQRTVGADTVIIKPFYRFNPILIIDTFTTIFV